MSYSNLEPEDFKKKLESNKEIVLLDVRTPVEAKINRIEGATLINFNKQEEFVEGISGLDKTKGYCIYCRSGNRSGQACNYMAQLGFGELYNLDGGMMAWEMEYPED